MKSHQTHIEDHERNKKYSANKFDTLPEHLCVYIFSFLSAKDTKRLQTVSVDFNKYSKKLINRTKKQLYYTAGEPLKIADTKNSCGQVTIHIRDHISIADIKSSFPKDKKIKLFSSESEIVAQNYVRSLRTDDNSNDDHIHQSIIFMVQFLKTAPELKSTLQINIKDYFERTIRECDVSFFETNVENVIPLLAITKIAKPLHTFFAHPQDGPIKEHPLVNYENLPKESKSDKHQSSLFRFK